MRKVNEILKDPEVTMAFAGGYCADELIALEGGYLPEDEPAQEPPPEATKA